MREMQGLADLSQGRKTFKAYLYKKNTVESMYPYMI